jgi:WD40 repeat protein
MEIIMTRSFSTSPAGKPVIDLSPDGRFIALGSADGIIQVITVMSLNLVFVLAGHTGPVSALAWSPDGKYLASGGDDHLVQVWNATNGTALGSFAGHTGPISLLAWSPDSTHLAASSGQQVRHWEIKQAL